METPIWKTPAFWRACAEEWRGPEKRPTCEGICWQLRTLIADDADLAEARRVLYNFKPLGARAYFFPFSDRTSRAELCDHIANTLEKEQQNETSRTQSSTQTTS